MMMMINCFSEMFGRQFLIIFLLFHCMFKCIITTLLQLGYLQFGAVKLDL